MTDYRIQEVRWADARTLLEFIRREVFVQEQKVPEEEEWDERDPDSIHLLAFSGNEPQPVGTVRLLPEGKITRMAVLLNHRGRGIGAALLHKALTMAGQLGLEQVYLDAQVGAVGFYQKYGFTAVGHVFLDAGIEHRHMTLRIKVSPITDNAVIRLEHASDVLPLLREFAGLAQRSIDIFSHQLIPALYDDAELVDAISSLARRGPQTQVRILVRDPRPLYGSDRPLLRLTQRLPSHMHIRAYIEGASDPRLGFFCVDEEHLIHFADEPALTGFARRQARAESRQLLDEFEHLWIYGSQEDANLRRLSL
jgi:predicted GNAT family N-acyltransferase